MGPLAGIKIIEIVGLGPAPFAAMLLADLGADIIRIDRPGGGTMGPGGGPYDYLGRNRKSAAVDLKTEAGRDLVLQLVEQADGLIKGLRPGVMERLGMGPEDCAKINPKLVYGRMTGWGQEGPMAQEVGHDINYISLSGALHSSAGLN